MFAFEARTTITATTTAKDVSVLRTYVAFGLFQLYKLSYIDFGL